MKPIALSREFRGRNIDVRAFLLDSGLSVLVTGGDRSHVGTVSCAAGDLPLKTVEFPGHEEGVISEKWAAYLFDKLDVPVVVSCGIHYDGISHSEILSILQLCDELLQNLASICEVALTG